jgi:predicted nucleic-acid-binding protein
MRAIDTNVLVRVIARDDKRQTEAALRTVDAGAWVSHLVLAETVWVLASYYARSRTEIANTVEVLLKHSTITLQDSETVAAALATYRAGRKAAFSDCLILEVARRAGHFPLGTFDRAFSKLHGVELVDA